MPESAGWDFAAGGRAARCPVDEDGRPDLYADRHPGTEANRTTEEENTETKEEKQTVIGVDADLEATAEKVGVENPVNILDTIGITQGELDSIKGVLAKYE